MEDDQGRSRRANRRQSDSHDGSTSSGVSWKSPPARSRGRPGTPERTVIDLMTPPSPSLQRVERNDESPRNVETRAGLSAWQHSTAWSIDIPSTARTSEDANELKSCDICRCSMGPDSDVFTFKCGKSSIAGNHKFHFACVAPYWERCQARSLPLFAELVECPKCRRQCVTSDEREGFDACLAERRLRQKRIATRKLNRSNRDNPVDVSESPAPAPAEASSSDAWLRSALRSRVESGGWERDGDSASPSTTTAPNAINSTSRVDVFADFNRAASPPTTTPPPNKGGGSVSSPGSPPFLASSAGVARERARTETALCAAAFVRSLGASVESGQSRGGDSALNAQNAAPDSATTGQDPENVQLSAGSHGS